MMKTLLLTLACAAVAFADCPAFTDWRDWSDTCAWFPLPALRQTFIDACDISVTGEFPEPPHMPEMPPACGHCSFKVRCKKRAKTEGCFPVDMEKQVCDQHSNVCQMPKFPLHNLGCKYELAPFYLRQCANRADLPEWKREGLRQMGDMLPQFHCKEVNGECKCCCHPYMPNEDGSACVQHDIPECEDYTPWTDWSDKCLWWPPAELRQDFIDHCDFEMKAGPKGDPLSKLKLPGDFQAPDRCGYCSFKIKCRKRDVKSVAGKKECFPLDVEKKACGPDDCETCGNTCEMPKLMGSCNYTEQMKKIIGPGIKSRMKKLPHSMQMGLMKMISHLPHGKCVEKDGKCMCCCHPYEPNADGTSCELKDVCKSAEDLGIEFDMNMPDDAWWW